VLLYLVALSFFLLSPSDKHSSQPSIVYIQLLFCMFSFDTLYWISFQSFTVLEMLDLLV